MGNLSEHFNHRDFFCNCENCKGKEYKIHLGMVGLLEQVWEHFQKPVRVVLGYRCEAENERQGKIPKSFHLLGKAAHVVVDGVAPEELIKYLKTLPEVHGIGLNADDQTVHIDTRRENRQEWVRESRNRYIKVLEEKTA